MPRGGRDNGDPWYEGGRTLRKQNTFDDTAAVLKSVQRRFRIDPKKTIFYGRSAGGFLAANIAQQYPHLVAAIYAEVPYVDVLRTTSNPDLPLTQMEYDEFGDPAGKIEDYVSLQQISPVDTVPVAPKNAPLCLIRTGINDAQVLPYEAVKWAKKLRAMGWTALVGIDMGGGHFAAESVIDRQYAEDAAILDHFVGSRRVSKTRKLRSHVTKGTRRRRTNSLKH
jgi:oligopeptidase B